MATSKMEKASEPSMDEILASIRKIISEEPAGAKKAAAGAGEAKADTKAGSETAQRAQSKQAVDDILGLADAEPQWPRPAAAAAAPAAGAAEKSKPGAGKVPSWLFPSSPEPTAAKGANAAAELKPFFPTPAAEADKATEAKPAAAQQQKPIDLGGIIPQRSGQATENRGNERSAKDGAANGRVPEWTARPGAVQKAQAQPQVLAAPEEPTRFVRPDADAQPALSGLSALRPGAPVSTVTSTVVPAVEPIAAVEPEPVVATPKIEIAAASVAESMAEAPQPTVGTAIAPPTTADSGKVPALAEAAKPEADHANGSAQSIVPQAAAEAPAGKPVSLPAVAEGAGIGRPTVVGERQSRAAKTVNGSELVATGGPGTAVKTLEDTVVELLRPMLRQWLDENMPRMVEKALRIEMAQSVKAKLEQQTH